MMMTQFELAAASLDCLWTALLHLTWQAGPGFLLWESQGSSFRMQIFGIIMQGAQWSQPGQSMSVSATLRGSDIERLARPLAS